MGVSLSTDTVPWTDFECWSPRLQTVDTELLSQRPAEYQYCLPEHMHGHAASAPSYVFVNVQIKQLAILQRTEIPIEVNFRSY